MRLVWKVTICWIGLPSKSISYLDLSQLPASSQGRCSILVRQHDFDEVWNFTTHMTTLNFMLRWQSKIFIWFHFWKTPRDFSWIMLFIPLNKTTVSTCSPPQSPAAKTCWEHESHRPVSLAWQPISGLSAQASQCLALACRGSFGCWDWKLQGGMGRVDP